MSEYTVEYDVYRVADRRDVDVTPAWFEYEVTLIGPDGDVVDRWDSYTETYNGIPKQRLDEDTARRSAERIKSDIEETDTDPSAWFNTEPDA